MEVSGQLHAPATLLPGSNNGAYEIGGQFELQKRIRIRYQTQYVPYASAGRDTTDFCMNSPSCVML